jgi:hypothetical protein
VPISPKKVGFVLDMGQHNSINDVVLKEDVASRRKGVDYVLGMVHRYFAVR